MYMYRFTSQLERGVVKAVTLQKKCWRFGDLTDRSRRFAGLSIILRCISNQIKSNIFDNTNSKIKKQMKMKKKQQHV